MARDHLDLDRLRSRPRTVPELANDLVRLRAVVPADAPSIVDISFYDGVPAATELDARTMLARIEADRARGECLHWGICLPGSDEVVGTIGFYRGFARDVGEVGYVLRPAVRGRGIMTHALALVVDHGLSRLGLKAVVARTDETNAPSIALLRRAGFAEVPAEGRHLVFEKRAHDGDA
jgi:[ribosomal protein S5]-alanine N-acetyltransferase